MDRFLVSKSKAGRNVTAQQRHSDFKGWTHVSGSKLLCASRDLVLDHTVFAVEKTTLYCYFSENILIFAANFGILFANLLQILAF